MKLPLALQIVCFASISCGNETKDFRKADKDTSPSKAKYAVGEIIIDCDLSGEGDIEISHLECEPFEIDANTDDQMQPSAPYGPYYQDNTDDQMQPSAPSGPYYPDNTEDPMQPLAPSGPYSDCPPWHGDVDLPVLENSENTLNGTGQSGGTADSGSSGGGGGLEAANCIGD